MNILLRTIRHNKLLFSAGREVRDMYSLARGLWSGSFSQHGEDRYLLDRFQKNDGFFVDIGASHPFRISNTYLLYRLGWCGVTVEPIPELGRLHRRWRPRDKLVAKAVGLKSGKMTFFEMLPSVLSTLDKSVAEDYVVNRGAEVVREVDVDVITPLVLFEKNVGERQVDFLSIDIEGLDKEVVLNIDLDNFRPEVISVEVNESTDYQILLNYFIKYDYQLVGDFGCNLLVEDVRHRSE